MEFTLRSNLPCILMDTSYYVFYRFFDSWKHIRNQPTMWEKICPTSELHTLPTFLKRIYYDIDSDISELLRAWKTVSSNIIFCKDCSRKNIWRNDHTVNYKASRPKKNVFNPHMFSLISQYCKDRRIQEMSLDKTEADDLIALTKKKLRENGFTPPIIIMTNDNDYLQLLDDNTHAYNMNYENNNLRARSAGSAKIDLRMKILMGDRSDNIPPVKQHMGPKKALRLATMTDQELYNYLAKHGCRETFDKNTQLIDFNYIRDDIRKNYDSSIKFEFNKPSYDVY